MKLYSVRIYIEAGAARKGDAVSWSIGFDERWQRDIGYGVPAYCDHPDCNEKIDRGLAYVCGAEPYGGDQGCGLYFCEKHQKDYHQRCERCAEGKDSFNPKPDHPEWLRWKLTDESWERWRIEHPETAIEMRKLLAKVKGE